MRRQVRSVCIQKTTKGVVILSRARYSFATDVVNDRDKNLFLIINYGACKLVSSVLALLCIIDCRVVPSASATASPQE